MPVRLRLLVPLTTALTCLAGPALVSGAAPLHHTLTIDVAPSPMIVPQQIMISGGLRGRYQGGRTIEVYRAEPRGPFTLVGKTQTNAQGEYEFFPPQTDVVTTGRWFARAPGVAGRVRSPIVEESVPALLTLSASRASTDTRHPVLFQGQVVPAGVHVGERIYLQRQRRSGAWDTIESTVIASSSTFAVSHHFVLAGPVALRAVFVGDGRNGGTVSDSVTVDVQQAQNPMFTIASSGQMIPVGRPVTISGVLYAHGATGGRVPASGVPVTLFGREFGQAKPVALDHASTASDGSYSFTESPQRTVEYAVRTTFGSPASDTTANLFEGVGDVATLTPSVSTTTLGTPVTFTGAVTPDQAGHPVELQVLGADGQFHTVARTTIGASSGYTFTWRAEAIGATTFRTRVPGDLANVSGVSPSATIDVTLP